MALAYREALKFMVSAEDTLGNLGVDATADELTIDINDAPYFTAEMGDTLYAVEDVEFNELVHVADPDTADALTVTVSADSALAWMWQENLGVEVEIQSLELDTLLEDLRGNKLQAFALGWMADYPDPENFLDLLFHSDSVENHTFYSNPVIDDQLEAARVESDQDARMEMYSRIEQTIINDAALLPLYFGKSYYLVKPEVKGFDPRPVVMPQLKDIWIEQ